MISTMLWAFGGALIGTVLAMAFRRRKRQRKLEDDRTGRR